MTLLGEKTSPVEVDGDDDDLDHGYCECDPDVAICGRDLTGIEEIGEDDEVEHRCVVCELMMVCPRCGAVFGGIL